MPIKRLGPWPATLADGDAGQFEQARGGREMWCYFNNDTFDHAIDDALTLRAMLKQAVR